MFKNQTTGFTLRAIAVALLFASFAFSLAKPLHSQESALDSRIAKEWTEVIRPILKEHCGECHMDSSNEGGVNLDDYQDLDKIRQHASTWEQIRGVIRADAMPPPESSTLKAPDREKLVAWMQSALHDVDCGCAPPTPKVTLRRLNQVEYDNTIQDLLGVELTPSKAVGFVSDDVGNGFDNQGEVLTLPPILLEKYLQAAAYVAKEVIETDRETVAKTTVPWRQTAVRGIPCNSTLLSSGQVQRECPHAVR